MWYRFTSGNLVMVSFDFVSAFDAVVIDIMLIDIFPRSMYENNMEKNIIQAIMNRVGIRSETTAI